MSTRYRVEDWCGNVLFDGKEFDTFDDAWSYVYEKIPNLYCEEDFYDDTYVECVERSFA